MTLPLLVKSAQRFGTLADLPALLREQGVNPADVFAGSGLDPEAVTPDTHASAEVVLSLLDRAVELSNCEHLGLLLGLRFTLEKHGPIGRLMRTAPTLGEALADFVSWQHGYSRSSIVYLSRIGQDMFIGFSVLEPRLVVSHPVYDFVIGVGVRMLAELTNGRVTPLEVHLSRREPEPGLPFTRLIRNVMEFNRPQNGLLLAQSSMSVPLTTHDAAARQKILQSMEAAMRAKEGHSGQVRRAIRRSLLSGVPRMPEVAQDLGIHPRTLRRRLAEDGTSFEALLDEVRSRVARELIELTDMKLAEVADALAFSSQSVFSDWFRRRFGTPPSHWPRVNALAALTT